MTPGHEKLVPDSAVQHEIRAGFVIGSQPARHIFLWLLTTTTLSAYCRCVSGRCRRNAGESGQALDELPAMPCAQATHPVGSQVMGTGEFFLFPSSPELSHIHLHSEGRSGDRRGKRPQCAPFPVVLLPFRRGRRWLGEGDGGH